VVVLTFVENYSSLNLKMFIKMAKIIKFLDDYKETRYYK